MREIKANRNADQYKPKGGRGIQAPYQTTHVRVPVPIKSQVENLITDYRLAVHLGQPTPSPIGFTKEELAIIDSCCRDMKRQLNASPYLCSDKAKCLSVIDSVVMKILAERAMHGT